MVYYTGMNTINTNVSSVSNRIANSGILGIITIIAIIIFFLGIGTGVLSIADSMKSSMPATKTISVTGKGERLVVPNIASLTYEVSKESDTVAKAQTYVTEKSNDILAYLKSVGIEDRDIKTVNYSIYPRYDYDNTPCYSSVCPSSGKRVFAGYTVTNSVEVKIRDIAKAGDVLSELGKRSVTNLNGLNFIVENEDAVRAEARRLAIADAKEKAQVLAKDLGVRIVRISSFSESGYGYYPPVMYSKAADAYGMGGAVAAPSPEIATGENKITTQVNITYEIR